MTNVYLISSIACTPQCNEFLSVKGKGGEWSLQRVVESSLPLNKEPRCARLYIHCTYKGAVPSMH